MTASFWPRSQLKQTRVLSIYREEDGWQAPDENTIPFDEEGEKIRYGKELIVHTAFYLGPDGIVGKFSNGMNCQNCHLNAGRNNFSNPFSAVASTYPKFRERSARSESIEFRVNECMQRSLNGNPLDTTSYEMQSIVSYLKWMGQGVPNGVRPKGAGMGELPFLDRAADTTKGKTIFHAKCQRCHGASGQGLWSKNDNQYTYPPLWGENSFNVSSGMYRISRLAGFIRSNMPYGVNYKSPELTNEEAWDVAAFIVSQPRSEKTFPYDWPDITTKPVDHPFGPYADSFSEMQHKYGPFGPIKNKKKPGSSE